jgi:glycine betaine/proline transport system ATP-binding protein
MQDEFLRLQKMLKKTIVFITHDFDEAVRLGDRIGIMKDGKLVQIAAPDDMVSNPADDYVREFTKNAPRDRIIKVGSIAHSNGATGTGNAISADARLCDAAAQVLSSATAVDVVDNAGRPVGTVDRAAMIAALYPEQAP